MGRAKRMHGIRKRSRVGGFTIVVALLVSGCGVGTAFEFANEPLEGSPPYGEINPGEAVAMILALQGDAGLVLLDVRTPAEVEAGHLPGAEDIDFRSGHFADEIDTLDREATYLIYCRTANRSGLAFDWMKEMGFEKVYDMQGGIRLWEELGYPICGGPLDDEHSCVGEYPSPPNGA
jgi:rhodanese-related sulfurtransferase